MAGEVRKKSAGFLDFDFFTLKNYTKVFTCGDPSRVTIYWMLVQPLTVDIVTSTSRCRSFMLVLTEIFISLCDGVRSLLVKKCLGKVY